MKFKKIFINSCILFGTSAVSFSVYSIEPKEFQFKGFEIVPTLNLDFIKDNNIFLTDNNEQESNITVINPKLEVGFGQASRKYSAELELTQGSYSESEEDDYLDWNILGDAQIMLSESSDINLNASFFSIHEFRGTGFSEGGNLPADYDEYDDVQFGLDYTILTKDKRGWAEIGLNYYNRGYLNNRFVTLTRDRESTALNGGLYYQILSNVTALVAFEHDKINYINDPIFDTLDSDETFVYIGAEWTLLKNTSGTLNLGSAKKQFVSSARDDISSLFWDATIRWEISDISFLSFNTKRSFNETKGVGSAIESTDYKLDWQYDLSSKIHSTINLNYYDDNFNDSNRKDNSYSFGAKINYAYSRWLNISLSFLSKTRDSDFSNYAYQHNLFLFGIEASL